MRIAFVSPFLFRCLRGIERWTVELCRALSRSEPSCEIDVLTWKDERAWPWGELPANVRLHPVALPRYFEACFAGLAYARLLRRLQPDVLNLCFTWNGEDLALRLLPRLRSKVNLVLHYPAAQVPHRYEQLRRSRAAAVAAHVIAQTPSVAGDAERWLSRRADVIPNGVDLERFRPGAGRSKARERLKLPPGGPVLLTTAALERRKGVHRALDALPALLKAHPDLTYLVAGEGPERASLAEQAKRLGLGDSVRLLGAIDDVVPLYQAADVFLLLSKGESFPLAAVEAMACGLPIVAARREPFGEILPPGGCVLVDEENPSEISAALAALLLGRDRRAGMGEENRRRAEARYSWDSVAAAYLRVFEEELGSPKESRP